MRKLRLLAPDWVDYAIYHCVSRTVGQEFLLGSEEKEHFVRLMRIYEKLCGVTVITFCVMDNHFHLLVAVPRRPVELPSNEELIRRIREAHGDGMADRVAGWFERWRESGNEEAIEAERERWFSQMWSLSNFIKVLKQCFTQWYNRRQPSGRCGTLWEARFRSVLVEDGHALQTMAAYIDLNPIRARIAADPKDYRWCGYAQACAGVGEAVAGLKRVAIATDPVTGTSAAGSAGAEFDLLSWYRQLLYGKGEERVDAEGRVVKPGFSEEKVEAVKNEGGHMGVHTYIHLRVRYFTCGLVLGTQGFVEKVFQSKRTWFSSKRLSGARRLQGLDLNDPLRTARDLALKPYG